MEDKLTTALNSLKNVLFHNTTYHANMTKIMTYFENNPPKNENIHIEKLRFLAFWQGVLKFENHHTQTQATKMIVGIANLVFTEQYWEIKKAQGEAQIELAHSSNQSKPRSLNPYFVIAPESTFTLDGEPLIWQEMNGNLISVGNIHSLYIQTTTDEMVNKIISRYPNNFLKGTIDKTPCLIFSHFKSSQTTLRRLIPIFQVTECNKHLEDIYYDSSLSFKDDFNITCHPFYRPYFQAKLTFSFERVYDNGKQQKKQTWVNEWQKHPTLPLWRPLNNPQNPHQTDISEAITQFKADFAHFVRNCSRLITLQKFFLLDSLVHFHCNKGYIIDTYSLLNVFNCKEVELKNQDDLSIKITIEQSLDIIINAFMPLNWIDGPESVNALTDFFQTLSDLANKPTDKITTAIAYWIGVAQRTTNSDECSNAITALISTVFSKPDNNSELSMLFSKLEVYRKKFISLLSTQQKTDQTSFVPEYFEPGAERIISPPKTSKSAEPTSCEAKQYEKDCLIQLVDNKIVYLYRNSNLFFNGTVNNRDSIGDDRSLKKHKADQKKKHPRMKAPGLSIHKTNTIFSNTHNSESSCECGYYSDPKVNK